MYDATTGGTTARVEEADDDFDPYNQLGYGFTAYFKSLQIFAWVFLLLTIIMLPAFFWYGQAGGLLKVTHGYYNSIFMLGNLGFNKAVCLSSYVQLNADNTTLSCEMENMYMSDLTYAGIIPNDIFFDYKTTPYGYCGNPNVTEGTENDQAPPGTNSCTATYLKYWDLEQDFNKNCATNTACSFRMENYINF